MSVRLPALQEAVRLLSDPRLGKGGAEWVQRTGWKLLPFLLLTAPGSDSPQLDLAAAVARTAAVAQHPLTFNWAQGEASCPNKREEKRFVVVVEMSETCV